MKRILPFAALVVTILCSCEQQEIPTYSGDNYIYFPKEKADEVFAVSFAVMPGVDEYELAVPVSVIGFMPEADLTFSVKVVDSGDNHTTLSPSSYSLPETPFVQAGYYDDFLKVKLLRTSELDEAGEHRLVLSLVDNENFKVGMQANATATIVVSNLLVRPDWWNADMETVFLGSYSDEKYTALIEATGMWDFTEVSVDDMQGYMRDFVYYLRAMDDAGTPVYEADGEVKVLDTINYGKE